jgi:archaellum biogenesis ATPase FlaH
MQEKPLKSWSEYAGEDRIISSHQMNLELKKTPDAILKIKSNIPALDAALDGFQDGELIVVSGPTKHGKTLFCQSLTYQFIKQQHFPLWFSYEVPTRQFLAQFPEMPYIYLPRKLKPHSIEWFEDRVMESFQKFHTRIVVADNLHFLLNVGKMKNSSLEIGQAVERLKTMAVNENFLIFLLAHTTKGASDGTLSFESIRDSSMIAQTADVCLMIRRTPENGDNTAILRVEFSRKTGVLEKVIELVKADGFLREREEDREETMRRDWQ